VYLGDGSIFAVEEEGRRATLEVKNYFFRGSIPLLRLLNAS